MKTELIAFAGQREKTCHEVKERKDIDLEFSLMFHLLVFTPYTCFLAGSVLTAVHPGSNFLTIFILS